MAWSSDYQILNYQNLQILFKSSEEDTLSHHSIKRAECTWRGFQKMYKIHATKMYNNWKLILNFIMSYFCFVCKYAQFPLLLSLSWSWTFAETWGNFKLLPLGQLWCLWSTGQCRVHGPFLQKAFLQWREMIKMSEYLVWIQLFIVAFAGTRGVMRYGLVGNGADYSLAVCCADFAEMETLLCRDENPARRSHLFLVLGIAIGESPGP